MHEFTLLPSKTFPTNILRALMSINAIITIRTHLTMLIGATKLFLAIISQRPELRGSQIMIVRILAVGFRAFQGIEIEHVTCPG